MPRVCIMSDLLMEKYSQQRRASVFQRLWVSRGADLLVGKWYVLSRSGVEVAIGTEKEMHVTHRMQWWKKGKDTGTITKESNWDPVHKGQARKARQGMRFTGCPSGDRSWKSRLVADQVSRGKMMIA
jgi:hypothetical protein